MTLIGKVVFMRQIRSSLFFFIILFFSPILFALAQQAEATPDLARIFTSEDGSLSPESWPDPLLLTECIRALSRAKRRRHLCASRCSQFDRVNQRLPIGFTGQRQFGRVPESAGALA